LVEGWPPADSEGLWAESLGGHTFRIDNTPWFVLNLAVDDVVTARAGDDGILWATGKERWSGRMTIRVLPLEGGGFDARQAVLDAFTLLGVEGEGIEQFGLIALDVPADVDVAAVKALLRAGVDQGRWEYEEGCISEAWAALSSKLSNGGRLNHRNRCDSSGGFMQWPRQTR
jgi:hypothetical protein